MMSSEFRVVRRITAEVLGAEEQGIREKTRFIGDLGADSLELFEILTRIEEEMRISLEREALQNIETVGDAVKYLTRAIHR